ncbi:MAG: MBL fold metallo-hydrolase [Chloroflexia bacterium]
MEVRLLGAHQGQSRDIGFMSILVDGRLAIDAGGLTTALTLGEQERVEAVLVTHRHFDHIKDLVGLAHNNWQVRSLHIYCIDDVRAALQTHVFNDVLWPTMSVQRDSFFPLTWHRVEAGVPLEVLGYRVTPIEVSHTVPAVGYMVEGDGGSFFYTADTRGDGDPPWAEIRPDLLIAETTMECANEPLAYTFGHMTPMSLGRELRAFHARQGYYPRTVCVHINPHQEAQVVRELAVLAEELGAEIVPGREGMIWTVDGRR